MCFSADEDDKGVTDFSFEGLLGPLPLPGQPWRRGLEP